MYCTQRVIINNYISFSLNCSSNTCAGGHTTDYIWSCNETNKFFNLSEVGDNCFSIFAMGLHHLLEMMMTEPDDLGKSLGPHSKRLWDVEHNPNFPCHI